jgi:alkylation response protein AidB-like acyl-CoA dehydrogenase
MGAAFMGTVAGVDSALYRLPIGATLATMALGTVVGIAECGMESLIAQTRSRVDAYTGERKALRAGLQFRVAESSAEITHAWSLAERSCDLLEAAMERPSPMDTAQRAEVRWNAAYGNELCRRATDRLFAAAGAKAAYDSHVSQRYFRDVNTSTHHGIFDFDTALEMRGKSLLGVEQFDALI